MRELSEQIEEKKKSGAEGEACGEVGRGAGISGDRPRGDDSSADRLRLSGGVDRTEFTD